MTIARRLAIACLAIACLASAPGEAAAGDITATFVQLNRASAEKTAAEWVSDVARMREAGIETIIVQWTVDGETAYFDTSLPYPEKFDAVGKLLAAALSQGASVQLGLVNDPAFWTQITARERVLRDYFLARVTGHERVQRDLLRAFGDNAAWTGYYIPDEIDDITWRHPAKRILIKDYLALLQDRLRSNDPGRAISISSFFRARTAPDIYADTLLDITAGLDQVLVQDGAGSGDPPPRYRVLYFRELRARWPADGPALWAIVEAFRQTSAGDQPFTAATAAPDALDEQVRQAAAHFDGLALFSFLDYADPALGDDAARLFEHLKGP